MYCAVGTVMLSCLISDLVLFRADAPNVFSTDSLSLKSAVANVAVGTSIVL